MVWGVKRRLRRVALPRRPAAFVPRGGLAQILKKGLPRLERGRSRRGLAHFRSDGGNNREWLWKIIDVNA